MWIVRAAHRAEALTETNMNMIQLVWVLMSVNLQTKDIRPMVVYGHKETCAQAEIDKEAPNFKLYCYETKVIDPETDTNTDRVQVLMSVTLRFQDIGLVAVYGHRETCEREVVIRTKSAEKDDLFDLQFYCSTVKVIP